MFGAILHLYVPMSEGQMHQKKNEEKVSKGIEESACKKCEFCVQRLFVIQRCKGLMDSAVGCIMYIV